MAGRFFTSWATKSKNTGVGSLSLLQQIFLTQESNWDLVHCRQIFYQLSYQGSSKPITKDRQQINRKWAYWEMNTLKIQASFKKFCYSAVDDYGCVWLWVQIYLMFCLSSPFFKAINWNTHQTVNFPYKTVNSPQGLTSIGLAKKFIQKTSMIFWPNQYFP